MLITISVVLILSYWPLTILLHIPENNYVNFLLPSVLMLLTYLLYKKENRNFLLPLLIIPFMSPKLSLFPVFFSLFCLLIKKNKRLGIIALTLSLFASFINWNSFIGQTIFIKDYEAEQKIIRDTQLYDSIFLARTFHNKARIYIDKFSSNFFALIDLNNYFFGNHPRQIPGAQNSERYPFLSIIFFLYGLYYLNKNTDKFFIISAFFSGILSLSILTIFDRNDFILWLPLGLINIYGLHLFRKIKFNKIFLLIFLLLTFVEYLRIFI